MKVHLTIVEGKPQGASVALHGSSFLIGRDPECQLRLKSESVGGRHCTLSVVQDHLTVRDLGTKMGTLLNGKRLDPSYAAMAYNGDLIQVGNLVFEVAIELEAKPTAPAISDDLEDDSPSAVANRLIQKTLSHSADPVKGVSHSFTSEMVEGVPVVTINMERIVDEAETIPFARGLRDLAERQTLYRVILNLKHVKKISPEGADRLLAFTERMKARGAIVKLCEVDPLVSRVLDSKGVTMQVSIHIDINDAIWAM